MSVDINRYNRLKKDAEDAQRRQAQAEGAITQFLKRMEKEFQCKSPEAAESLLEKLQEEGSSLEEEFQEAMDAFTKKHSAALGESDDD